jgi:hypothetical protein
MIDREFLPLATAQAPVAVEVTERTPLSYRERSTVDPGTFPTLVPSNPELVRISLEILPHPEPNVILISCSPSRLRDLDADPIRHHVFFMLGLESRRVFSPVATPTLPISFRIRRNPCPNARLGGFGIGPVTPLVAGTICIGMGLTISLGRPEGASLASRINPVCAVLVSMEFDGRLDHTTSRTVLLGPGCVRYCINERPLLGLITPPLLPAIAGLTPITQAVATILVAAKIED